MLRWFLTLLFVLAPLHSGWAQMAAQCALPPIMASASASVSEPHVSAASFDCDSRLDHHGCSACHLVSVAAGPLVVVSASPSVSSHVSGREAETFLPSDIPEPIERPKW